MMELTESRFNHCLNVARKMREIVQGNPDLFDCKPEEMFYLGFVHDVAYEFVDDQTLHEHTGGELLKDMGFKYWKEVYYHGDPDSGYSSPELILLNWADLTTGPNGEDMTMSERLQDIADRYGDSSMQYENAKKLSEIVTHSFIRNLL